MNDDGSMARVPQLMEFARQYRLKIITIADLINYRMKEEKLVKKAAETELPTQFGNFKLIVYENSLDDYNHVALVMGEMDPEKPMLVRVHSECFTGDEMCIRDRINTVIKDNPVLTTRLTDKEGKDANRIILDSGARLPLDAKVINPSSKASTIVVATEAASQPNGRSSSS